jgi:hypothetical protein
MASRFPWGKCFHSCAWRIGLEFSRILTLTYMAIKLSAVGSLRVRPTYVGFPTEAAHPWNQSISDERIALSVRNVATMRTESAF